MGRSVYRELPDNARDALIRVAADQVRSPSEQIAWFVLDGLKRANALPAESQDCADASSAVARKT